MRIRKKLLFYVLATSSALIAAINSGFDAIITVLYIKDPWAFGIACFFVGTVIALIFSIILSIPIKGKSIGSRVLDPSFSRIRLIRREEVKYQLLSGLGNSIYTIGYFALLSIMPDPSVILPFTQMVILYLVIMESITEKNLPTLIEIQSSVIVTFGAILGSISLTGTVNIESLIIVFFVINPAWMISSIYQRKLKLLKIDERPNDSINIRLWNVTFAFIITAIIVFIFDTFNNGNHLIDGITASFEYFNWVGFMAVLTFFSLILYIRALGFGKASVTQAIKSSSIIFAIPVSIVLSIFAIIQPFSNDPVLLLIKFIGVVLMVFGIASFALTLVKAYVFITLKPGFPLQETMDKLWNIRGVTRVCATAGPYDFIIKIRIRTLVKGYENVVKKLDEIEAINKYKWESVLKDWENI